VAGNLASGPGGPLGPAPRERGGFGLNLASRTQVSGHYFLRRRLGFAFLRRSVRMEVDPVRWQRVLLMLSGVVAVVLLIGALVVGWFRPAGQISDSTKIVAERKSGTLYAVVDGRLHPALNLVSAQLIAGSPDLPTFVNADELAKWPKGPTVGIVGAPVDAPRVTSPEVSRWAVCDTASTTVAGAPTVTGINGELTLGEGADLLGDHRALLMSYGDQAFVVHAGVRMPVDLADRTVTEALGIEPGALVQGMSRALYDAIPAGGPLVVPVVPNAGAPARFDWGPSIVVGTVVSSQDVTSGADRFYVVVGDGVQPVTPVAAAMLRQHESFGATTPPKVPPDRLAQAPTRHVLDIDYYPTSRLQVIDPAAQPVACVAWEWKDNDRQAQLHVVTGRGLPITSAQQGQLIKLVGGGSDGVQANQVLLGTAPATFVTATGSALDSPRRETIWLISESGSRYGVPFDEEALRALGLVAERVRPAPWSMLQVWPAGTELSRAAALTVHDSLEGAAAPVQPPTQQQGG
jgi:type VII secretion protein EccB